MLRHVFASHSKIDGRRKMHFPKSTLGPGIKLALLIPLLTWGVDPSYSAAPLGTQEMSSLVEREYDSLFQLYRHLHSNPELSYREAKTAERIGKELEVA